MTSLDFAPQLMTALRTAMATWAPPPDLTVSEWADAERVLSAEASAEPGQWRTDRAEYQRGIMDAVSDPSVDEVVVMKSAQVGWTEIVNNVVGFHMHHDPAPILVVQPTVEMAETWSKDRLAPMLRDSPALRDKVADPRSRDSGNTLLHKTFAGGHLTIVGANSPAGLASRPIRVLLFDEVDRYPASAGSEGDPVTLGIKRAATFWNRKVLLGSTPTIAGHSRIEAAYEQSDKRLFHVPCPDCGEAQPLVWQNVRWPEGRPQEAGYCCAACGSVWTDAQRWAAIRRGEWRATAEFRGRAGFHLSELYSPWRRLSETASDFLEAKDAPDRLRAWVNTALGETWQERGEAPDWQRLYERREDWRIGTCPADCLVLTAGADVQRDRIEVSVWGWGRGLRSWMVDHIVLDGDPSQPAVWGKLTELLGQTWPHERGKRLGLRRLAIDTGFESQAVYAWCREQGRAQVMAVKGVPTGDRATPVDGPSYVEVSERGRKIRRGLQLWKVAVPVFKAETYGWLRLSRPSDETIEESGWPAGYVHMPASTSAEFVQQLTAEQLVTVRTRQGYQRREWQKLRDRNEALDCRVYARAAAWLMGLDRWEDRRWEQVELDLEPAATAPVARADATQAAAERKAGGSPKRKRWFR